MFGIPEIQAQTKEDLCEARLARKKYRLAFYEDKAWRENIVLELVHANNVAQ